MLNLPNDPDAPLYDDLRAEQKFQEAVDAASSAGHALGRAMAQMVRVMDAWSRGYADGMRDSDV